ncbi:MAG: hypothetical protein WAN93_00490 [Solirubrobacteraceae bacterium]
MPRASEARAWWADVEDVRERIELRRARESRAQAGVRIGYVPARRGVREVRPGQRLMLVESAAQPTRSSRRRPRPRVSHRVGPRPDRIAAWAVVLGFLLVVVAILSAHG